MAGFIGGDDGAVLGDSRLRRGGKRDEGDRGGSFPAAERAEGDSGEADSSGVGVFLAHSADGLRNCFRRKRGPGALSFA